MSGQPPSENSPGSDAPGQPPSGIPPSSGTTPSTSGTGTPGLSIIQITVATTNTLKDPYPVSIKSIRSLKTTLLSYTSNAQMAHFTTWNSCGGRNEKPPASPPMDHLNGLGEREMIEFPLDAVLRPLAHLSEIPVKSRKDGVEHPLPRHHPRLERVDYHDIASICGIDCPVAALRSFNFGRDVDVHAF